MIFLQNLLIDQPIRIGIVRAEGIHIQQQPDGFGDLLQHLIAVRHEQLTGEEETLRSAVRDMLRNGAYKPTGRGKPASEYLVRAAREANGVDFPHINAAVDICNYISLKYLLPISIWDLDLATTASFLFRLGKEGERYVFNVGGQEIDLQDLVVGCRKEDESDSSGEPIVNPVKDSLRTKTTSTTRRVAASIYIPSRYMTADQTASICVEFAELLGSCGESVDVAFGQIAPGEQASV